MRPASSSFAVLACRRKLCAYHLELIGIPVHYTWTRKCSTILRFLPCTLVVIMMAFRVFLFAFVVAAIATPWPSNQNSVVDVAGKRNFLFFGINESGPEFGEKNFTGVKNKEVSSTLATCERSF
jgi:hypothetical protein